MAPHSSPNSLQVSSTDAEFRALFPKISQKEIADNRKAFAAYDKDKDGNHPPPPPLKSSTSFSSSSSSLLLLSAPAPWKIDPRFDFSSFFFFFFFFFFSVDSRNLEPP